MAQFRVKGESSKRRRLRPLITAVLVVAVVVVLWTQRAMIAQIAQALVSGSLPALAVALVFELGRITLHAYAYTRSFCVIGAKVPLKLTIPAWFKALFMNTVLPSGGTSGLAAVIDTARTRGVPVGSATSAVLFTQTSFYSAMFLVLVVGMVVMGFSGTLTARDVLLSSLVGVAALAFLGLLAFGHLAPGTLQKLMRSVERLVVEVCARLHLPKTPQPWADKLVRSFSNAATELSRSPRRALTVFLTMVGAMACDLIAFVASGFAFGISSLQALLAGYVTALVFNSFSPTPGGVGLVEGLSAAVIATYGYPGALSLSAVLTYRAFIYWIPFVVGGVLMRVTGAFTSGAAEEGAGKRAVLSLRDRVYDTLASKSSRRATMAAIAVTAVAVFQMVASSMPRDAQLLETLAAYMPVSVAVDPLVVVSLAFLLILCAAGLLIRDQGVWLFAIAVTALLGMASTLAGNGLGSELAVLVVLALLVAWHDSFDKHTFLRSVAWLAKVLVFGVLAAALYAVAGMLVISSNGGIAGDPGFLQVVWLALQALVVPIDPAGLDVHAAWYTVSCRAVAWTLMLGTAFVVVMLSVRRVHEYRSPEARAMRAFNREQAQKAAELRKSDREEARRESREAKQRAREEAAAAKQRAREEDAAAKQRAREEARRERKEAKRRARDNEEPAAEQADNPVVH